MARLKTEPLPGGLGARVEGLEAASLDEQVLGELKELLETHSLLLATAPDLGEQEQLRIANAIGTPTSRGGYGTSPDRGGSDDEEAKPASAAMYVSNTRDDGILGKGRLDFHHDHLFYEQPLRAIMLYGIEIPPSGSETHFRSGVSALQALPEALRKRAEEIECLHLYDFVKLAERRYADWDDPETATPGSPRDYKPLVYRQPSTGRRALLLSQSTIDFRGIDREPGITLFKELQSFMSSEQDRIATYEHQWRPDDLLIWDNLMVAHARMPFDKNEPRTLRRTPIL